MAKPCDRAGGHGEPLGDEKKGRSVARVTVARRSGAPRVEAAPPARAIALYRARRAPLMRAGREKER
ncbi:hypothetical protein WME97_32415 [Sorangium sp. So ce367]|uniref:hypothetical protein n=1 Tax=Sorangium sp. So ce367 TaxID=3133305 RepID=UPI003F61E155